MKAYYECRNMPLQVTRMDDFVFPLHLHSDVEIIFVSEGQVSVHIDGARYMIGRGEIGIVFPNVVHGYLENPKGNGKGVFLLFPPESSVDYGSVIVKRRPVLPVLRKERLNGDIDTVLRLLLAENEGGGDHAVLRAYMQVILARIMPELELRDAKEHAGRSTLYQLLAYLAEHYCEPVTLEELAERFHLSVSYISHIFSDTVKVNFRAYVNALRLLRATEMLKASDAAVTQICFDCGFESQRTFNRAFREHYGMTPTEYRNDRARAEGSARG